MPIEPKFIPIRVRGRSIMRKSIGLLIATVLAVGLLCAPASAQDDDDDDDRGTWNPIPLILFSGGSVSTKSSPSLKGNVQNPRRGGLSVHNPSVRLNAAPWPGRRAIAEQAQMMRASRPLLHPAGARHVLHPVGARHVGFGRRF
jgi:hypothetical protein